MPSLVDPSVVLPSFQHAMETGEIDVHPCTLDKTLHHHLDSPNGEPRVTYVRLNEARQLIVLVQFLQAQAYEGAQCFDVGWAVPLKFRGKGLAGDTFLAALRELQHAFFSAGRNSSFYVEGIIGTDNFASLKTAEKVFASPGVSGIDSNSGEPILQFVRRVDKTSTL